MLSAKNKLQEYCQKNKLSFPIYTANQHIEDLQSSTAGRQWISCVTLEEHKLEFWGDYKPRKTDAEISSAEKALKYLEQSNTTKTENTKYPVLSADKIAELARNAKCVYLLDVENIPQAITENKYQNLCDDHSNLVIGFVGYLNALSQKPFPKNMHRYIVNSAISDSVDHTISFFAGYIASLQNNGCLPAECLRSSIVEDCPNIYIVTKDKFGEVLPKLGFNIEHKIT